MGGGAPLPVLSLTKEGVKGKALFSALKRKSSWECRSLGGVSSETQGRVVRQAHYRLRGVARGFVVSLSNHVLAPPLSPDKGGIYV